MAATARPVGVPVSMPSRKARNRDSTFTELGDSASYFGDGTPETIDGGHDHGVALAGVVQQGRQARPVGVDRTRELVGENLAGFDAMGSKCDQSRS